MINNGYNSEKILTKEALLVLKGLWISMRYSISINDVNFSYKPLITMLNYDDNGKIDIENIDGDHSINKTILKIRSLLDDNVCGLLSFPMKMAFEQTGKSEQFVTCLLVVSKLGVLDVFMASRSGCDFIRYGLDKIMSVTLESGPIDLESAISMLVDLETPVKSPYDMDTGYYVVEDGSTFFFQDEDGSISQLDQINSIILGTQDNFINDPVSEDVFIKHIRSKEKEKRRQ